MELDNKEIDTAGGNSAVTIEWVELLRYRMYGLVPYNLSPIQQGIQYGHAVQEYNNDLIDITQTIEGFSENMKSSMSETMEDYRQVKSAFDNWRKNDKTFIILNGGTTNGKVVKSEEGTLDYVGTLNQHAHTLKENGVRTAEFYEPDLGDQLTAVVFLVDERVWDYEKYPPQKLGGAPTRGNRRLAVYVKPESDENYAKRLGGEKNVWMREFLSQFKLA